MRLNVSGWMGRVLVTSCVFMMGCATDTYVLYKGPARQATETAVVSFASFVHLRTCDGVDWQPKLMVNSLNRAVGDRYTKQEMSCRLMPGEHKLSVYYMAHWGTHGCGVMPLTAQQLGELMRLHDGIAKDLESRSLPSGVPVCRSSGGLLLSTPQEIPVHLEAGHHYAVLSRMLVDGQEGSISDEDTRANTRQDWSSVDEFIIQGKTARPSFVVLDITTDAQLTDVLQKNSDWRIRRDCVAFCTNQPLLELIAKSDSNTSVRDIAKKRLGKLK